MPVSQMLSELPRHCRLGVKRAAKAICDTGAVTNYLSIWPMVRCPSRLF